MTINDIQDELIDEFSMFGDWMEKYEYIIQLGKELPLIKDEYKVDENLIRGCQAKVWLHADFQDGLIHFTADSDAIITKGLVSMVVRVLSGHTPDEIVHAELYFVDKVGLREHLSVTRSNGLLSMIKQMKVYALALKTKAS
ncbi:SufE family protein [Paraflavitalea sp. CAU 1676]|uniref:SufE family protein n=1 Tax=Paraflavitalea sp. CAU 1676 TaxID=3032598 RepID=UPI0023DA878D|nr:SufE family protein [Paraflavitalea sp. CAU 1676]MDF2186938.1 SufE family protein [Paraflavitalea sp. CAU 1676]